MKKSNPEQTLYPSARINEIQRDEVNPEGASHRVARRSLVHFEEL